MNLEGATWVRLSFIDVMGASHAVEIPATKFDEVVRRGEPFDGSALEGRVRFLESDMLLRPDPATLVVLNDGLARAVCGVATSDGAPWPGDPRMALAAVLADVAELAADFTVAAELEFYLLDADGQPIDRASYLHEADGPGAAIVRDAADRMGRHGVAVESCHHEAGPGQYEIDLSARPPLEQADALVLTRQLIRDAAAAAGVRATFMARPLADEAGSGLHLHQRVAGRFFDDRERLDEVGRQFVAGELAHARVLTALAAPTVNSYKRLHAGPEAPSAAIWGHRNRNALIRIGLAEGWDPSIEYRGADPSANPYLLFAGLLAAGAHGLEAELELDPPNDEDAGGFDPVADRQRFTPLPRDLDDALDALLADDVLVDAFDGVLLNHLVDGRRAEAADYRGHVTTWELQRYLDEA